MKNNISYHIYEKHTNYLVLIVVYDNLWSGDKRQ